MVTQFQFVPFFEEITFYFRNTTPKKIRELLLTRHALIWGDLNAR